MFGAMPSDNELELHRQLHQGQEKYAYLLLAAAASGIALAVRVTSNATLHWSLIPLGLAVCSWGLSFYYGCRYIGYRHSTIYANAALFRVQRGDDPEVGSHPQLIQAASEGIRNAMETNNKTIMQLGKRQFQYLVAGAVLFVGWHVLGIVLRG